MTNKGTLTQVDINLLGRTFATKKDLVGLVTKKDLVELATKKDLNNYVSKGYLDVRLDQQKDDIIDEFKKFRSDFYVKIDPILKEVTAKSKERTVQADQIKRHEDRIEALEKCCPQNGHLVAPI
jgi:hypothetical protein